MIIGQSILSQDSTNGDDYYSPWFPRGGNKAVFSCEVIQNADTTNDIDTFTIQVQTKNQEDSDKDLVNLLGTAASITLGTAETVTTFSAGAKISDTVDQGMMELVRFKYTVKAKSGGLAWVHFRMLNPAWVAG